MKKKFENKVEFYEKHYQEKLKYLIKQYELVKNKKHESFKKVMEFYKFYEIDFRTFLKYYKRYKENPEGKSLCPQKRGPKYKTRRTLKFIENKVIEQRLLGNGRYEIHSILKPILKESTPSPSCIYLILKRGNLNKLKRKMKEKKRRWEKKRK